MPKANYRKASYTDRQYTNNKKTERSTSGRNNVLNKPAKYKGPKKKSKTKKLDDAVSAMAKKFRESEEGKAFAKDKAAKAKKAGYKLDESGRIQKPKKEKKAAKPISRPKPQGSTSGGSKSYSRPVRSGVRSGQQRNRSVGPTQTPKEKLEPIIRSGQKAAAAAVSAALNPKLSGGTPKAVSRDQRHKVGLNKPASTPQRAYGDLSAMPRPVKSKTKPKAGKPAEKKRTKNIREATRKRATIKGAPKGDKPVVTLRLTSPKLGTSPREAQRKAAADTRRAFPSSFKEEMMGETPSVKRDRFLKKRREERAARRKRKRK